MVIDSNDCLGCSQEDYYDFYGFNEDCHEKIDLSEEVIVIVIAAFLALSCRESQK